jgi:hypothetical protein
MTFNANGTGAMNLPALSYIDMSGGGNGITVNCDLLVTGHAAFGGASVGSQSVVATTALFTSNVQVNGNLVANQLYTGGLTSGSQSIVGTTASFSSNVAIGGFVEANNGYFGGASSGSQSVVASTALFTSSVVVSGGNWHADVNGNLSCFGLTCSAISQNTGSGNTFNGGITTFGNLTVHGTIINTWGTIPQASTSFPTPVNSSTMPGLTGLGGPYLTDVATIASTRNVLNDVVQVLNNAGIFF